MAWWKRLLTQWSSLSTSLLIQQHKWESEHTLSDALVWIKLSSQHDAGAMSIRSITVKRIFLILFPGAKFFDYLIGWALANSGDYTGASIILWTSFNLWSSVALSTVQVLTRFCHWHNGKQYAADQCSYHQSAAHADAHNSDRLTM